MSENIEKVLSKEGFITAFLIRKMKRECPTREENELHNRVVKISKLNTDPANNSMIMEIYLNKENSDIQKFFKVVYIPEILEGLVGPETDLENFEYFGNIYQELNLREKYEFCSPSEKNILKKENVVTDNLKFNQNFVHGWPTDTINIKKIDEESESKWNLARHYQDECDELGDAYEKSNYEDYHGDDFY
jgi:hypothetical protein